MSIKTRVAQGIFVVCVPIFLFTAAIGFAFNSQWLYRHSFAKNEVTTVTGISLSELNKAAGALIKYWNSREEIIDIVVEKNGEPFALFNEREVSHLKDVKNMVRLDYIVFLITGFYILVYSGVAIRSRRAAQLWGLASAGFYGSILCLGAIVIVGIAAAIDFVGLWHQFHLLSFANDLWLLDPSCDYLIMMFPEEFWLDAALIVGGMMVVSALLVGASSWLQLRKISKVR